MAVELTHGTPADDRAVGNLFIAYFYEMAAWDPGILMNEYGLPVWHEFEGDEPQASPARTPEEQASGNWWIRDRCVRYAVRAGGAAVGFALVCEDLSLLPYPVPAESEFEILDFYVAPKVRRSGVGARTAALVLERHRGNVLDHREAIPPRLDCARLRVDARRHRLNVPNEADGRATPATPYFFIRPRAASACRVSVAPGWPWASSSSTARAVGA